MSLFAFACGHVLGPASPKDPYDQNDPDCAYCDGCKEWLLQESFDRNVDDCCRLLEDWHASPASPAIELSDLKPSSCEISREDCSAVESVSMRGGAAQKPASRFRSYKKHAAPKIPGRIEVQRSSQSRVQKDKQHKNIQTKEARRTFEENPSDSKSNAEEVQHAEPSSTKRASDRSNNLYTGRSLAESKESCSTSNGLQTSKGEKSDPGSDYDSNREVDKEPQTVCSSPEVPELPFRSLQIAAETRTGSCTRVQQRFQDTYLRQAQTKLVGSSAIASVVHGDNAHDSSLENNMPQKPQRLVTDYAGK